MDEGVQLEGSREKMLKGLAGLWGAPEMSETRGGYRTPAPQLEQWHGG